jgi:hypothetical protein
MDNNPNSIFSFSIFSVEILKSGTMPFCRTRTLATDIQYVRRPLLIHVVDKYKNNCCLF